MMKREAANDKKKKTSKSKVSYLGEVCVCVCVTGMCSCFHMDIQWSILLFYRRAVYVNNIS